MTNVNNVGQKVLHGFEAVPVVGIAPGFIEVIYRIIDLFKKIHQYLEAKNASQELKDHKFTKVKVTDKKEISDAPAGFYDDYEEAIVEEDSVAKLLSNAQLDEISPWEEKQNLENLRIQRDKAIAELKEAALRLIPVYGFVRVLTHKNVVVIPKTFTESVESRRNDDSQIGSDSNTTNFKPVTFKKSKTPVTGN